MHAAGRTHPGPRLALYALLACGLATSTGCKSAPQLGHAVALSLLFDASVDAPSLAAITGLVIHVNGDEAYDRLLELGRAPQREEGLVYRPAAGSRVIDVLVTAVNAGGEVLARGDTGTLRLGADDTLAVDLILGATSTRDGGADLADGSDLDMGDRYRAAILADHPRAYYRFGETSGTTAADESGNGYAGNYYGGVSLGVKGAISGSSGTAVRFFGPAAAGVVVQSTILDLSGRRPYSIEAWLSPLSIMNGYNCVFSVDVDDAFGRQALVFFLQSGLGLQVERWIDGAVVGNAAPAPGTSKFTHVALVYDGAAMNIYVDGFAAAGFADARPARPFSAPVYFGTCGFSAEAIDGSLDEAAVYDVALTPAQVKAHRDIGLGL